MADPAQKDKEYFEECNMKYYSYIWSTSTTVTTEVSVKPKVVIPSVSSVNHELELTLRFCPPRELKAHFSLISGPKELEVCYQITGSINDQKITAGSGIAKFSKSSDQNLKLFQLGYAHSSEKCSTVKVQVEVKLFSLELPLIRGARSIDCSHQLHGDLRTIFNDSEDVFKDVTIFAGPEKAEIKASKLMLCARSTVFNAMLNSEMKEKATGTIDLRDMDVNVCRELVSYIHTDETPNITDMAEKLFCAAHMYQLFDLQTRCANVLASQLSVENAAHLLVLSSTHSGEDGEFEDYVTTFITRDKSICKQVTESDGWAEVVDQPVLLNKVLQNVLYSEPPAKKRCI